MVVVVLSLSLVLDTLGVTTVLVSSSLVAIVTVFEVEFVTTAKDLEEAID